MRLSKKEKSKIIEKAVKAIVKQGGPSIDATDLTCQYHSADGRRCAVGHFIYVKHYRKGMEGLSLDDDVVRTGLQKSGFETTEARIQLLEDLQSAHDDSGNYIAMNYIAMNSMSTLDFFHQFAEGIKEVCEKHGTPYPEELFRECF